MKMRLHWISAAWVITGITVGAAKEQPNILFLLSDDQDWTGLSVQTHPDLPGTKSSVMQTPNIAKLASEGMRFSAAYAPSPVCSPTRISIQTGMSPAQLHWTKAAPTFGESAGYKLVAPTLRKSIRSEETTIAELLRTAGYATAHYGKWHISGGGPERHGYDESDGDTGNGDAAPHKGDNPVDIFGMGRRAAAFMEKSKKAGKPFFIQMSYHALHYPGEREPEDPREVREARWREECGTRRHHGGSRHGGGGAAREAGRTGAARKHLRHLHVRQWRRWRWRRR